VALATGAIWLGALAAVRVPQGPPDLGELLATALAALGAVALVAALGIGAGAELALSRGGEGFWLLLHAAASVPSVALGSALLVAWCDAGGLQPGIWLVTLGLGLLNLPQAILLAMESFSGRPELAEGARALGAGPREAAAALFGAVRGEIAAILLQTAGRSLGEAALVALLAQSLSGGGMIALRSGNTLASRLWYLEIAGRTGDARTFWPVALLLALAALSVWLAELAAGTGQEEIKR